MQFKYVLLTLGKKYEMDVSHQFIVTVMDKKFNLQSKGSIDDRMESQTWHVECTTYGTLEGKGVTSQV